MPPTLNKSYTALCILISSFWGLCYGFVLLSSATGAAGGFPQENVLEPGSTWDYELKTSVLLNERGETNKDVGFLISGSVVVESLWGNSNLERLLKFQLNSPQLFIRSRKAPAPDGFVHHTSKLDSFSTTPFLVHWKEGKIQKILLQKDEPLSLANMKKGIASLFQFQITNNETKETDSSGNCLVHYSVTGSHTFTKSKSSCVSSDLPYISNPELILSAKVESTRTTNYEMDDKNQYLKSATFWETHTMFTEAKEYIGNKVEAYQSLTLSKRDTVDVIKGNSLDEAVESISSKTGIIFTQESLITEKEPSITEDTKSFQNTVNEYRDNLKNSIIGSLTSAKVVSTLISVGRVSNKEDITKTLGLKKNQAILHQLYDILGYVQTEASHKAAMKKLHFDDSKHEELSERYLWALSMSSQPNPDIIMELVSRYRKVTPDFPVKVKDTLVMTIAAMAQRISKLAVYSQSSKVFKTVEEAILNGLDSSKKEDRYVFLRALKNLKSKATVPKLLKIIKKGTDKERVLAWKAIRSFDSSYWTNEVLGSAKTVFFQMDKKHDSSARTLALDVILEANPNDEMLNRLIYFLLSECKAHEVLQYLVQRLKMISQQDAEFKNRIEKIVRGDSQLNNYAVLADKGLSTALMRSFLQSPSSNGSLVTIQEIQNGIVKRGIVNVVMEKNDVSQEIFSLGIFSGGLGSFISSDAGGDPDEVATAGIELTVLGTQIRPFVFFNGQGELMGHVWSGTASEKTTAFQALAMLHDHQEYLRLGPGFIAELDLKGATSFDLSGKIEISLWNRNAVSHVEKSAGIVVLGLLRVDTSFVKSQVEFSVLIEPKLNLHTDIDFSSNVNLCMRLSQPDSIFRHSIFKIERIPGSKHRLRKVKYRKYTVPGKTYSLNQKNNEMCNLVFK